MRVSRARGGSGGRKQPIAGVWIWSVWLGTKGVELVVVEAGCGGEAGGMVGRRSFMTRKGRVVNGCCAHPGKGEEEANGGIRSKSWSD